jgi:hypothetical protein
VQASASKTRPAGTYGAFADEAIFRKPRNSPETEQGLACSPQTQSMDAQKWGLKLEEPMGNFGKCRRVCGWRAMHAVSLDHGF